MAMSRGYWLPDNHENLLCCAGFYIPANVINKTGDAAVDWEIFERSVCSALLEKDKTLNKYCSFRTRVTKPRYVLARNSDVDIVAEQFEGPRIQNQAVEEYVAVYAIIPEDCGCPEKAECSFDHYLSILQDVLCAEYPGHVFERVNSRKIATTVQNKRRRRRRRQTPLSAKRSE